MFEPEFEPNFQITLKTRLAPLSARLSSLLRRFVKERRAVTSVEFALVAAPFLALIFAILETAIVFFGGQTLETAAATAGRLIMTGQAQIAGWSATQFKQQVCNQVTTLFSCANGVYIDVETYSSFSAANLNAPISNGNFDPNSLGYNPGGPGDIVVVRVYYQYPAAVTMLGFNLSNLNNGIDLLAATAVFKNEPYTS